MARQKKPESLLAIRLANHIKVKYPYVIFHFDNIEKIGMVEGKLNKQLHGAKLNRGFPDLTLFGFKKPLLLELKAGSKVPNTSHTQIQALYHASLRRWGYEVYFCCGFDDCRRRIDKYMKKRGKVK